MSTLENNGIVSETDCACPQQIEVIGVLGQLKVLGGIQEPAGVSLHSQRCDGDCACPQPVTEGQLAQHVSNTGDNPIHVEIVIPQ